MKIIFINPYVPGMGDWPPLGLAYLAGMLEGKGISTRIVDRGAILRRGGDPDKVTAETLMREKPAIVGLTGTTPLIPDVYQIARLVRGTLPGATIILGGTHANILPAMTLDECPEIDAVCLGEGEYPVVDLAEGKAIREIPGMVFRDAGGIVSNPPRPRTKDMDGIPFPARHLLDMELYTSPETMVIRGIELRATHLFTARGCPFKCTFCAGASVFGSGVRFHSPGYVLDEMSHLADRYRLEGLYFAEDMFLSNRKRALEICEGMIDRGLHNKLVWAAQVRPDVVDESILSLMRKAGCIQLEFGFESGSQRVLDRIRKRATVEENLHAARLSKKMGFRIVANMLVGIPGETKEDLLATIRFIKSVRPEYVGFNRLVPLPGSEIYDELARQGRIGRDWGRFRFDVENFGNPDLNFTAMDAREIERIAGSFARRYLRPRHIWHFIMANLRRNPSRFIPRMVSLGWENRALISNIFGGK